MELTINQSFFNAIRSRLVGNGISQEDFSISQKAGNANRITINIKYLYSDSYFYTALIDNQGAILQSKYSPGEITSQASKSNMNSEEFLTNIEDWVYHLRDEMKNTLLGRQLHETQKKVAELETLMQNKFNESEDTFFTKEEGNDLKEKLDNLENLYRESILAAEENSSNPKTEYRKLHEEVQLLKEQVEYLSKKKWATALMIKLMNWTSLHPAATKQIGQTAIRALLPKEVEESLPALLPPTDEE